jgi:DNA-binding NtrC family response regulator
MDREAMPTARVEETHTVKKKATILVVEDEDLLREVISEFLIAGGHKVIATGNLQEACRLAVEQRLEIDLLLSDVVLKGGNSKQLVQRLTEQGCTFRVVYMPGYTPNAIVHHGVLQPGTLFLQKPFTQAMLLNKIEEALSLGVDRV